MGAQVKAQYNYETKTVTFTGDCLHCKKPQTLTVSPDQFRAYETGVLIQDAFPHLDAGQREYLISGICGPCFDAMFGEPEEEPGNENG